MVKNTSICPYFGGVTQKGKGYLIKCCNNYLSFGTKEQADDKASKDCEKQMDSCRPFLFSQLKEMGIDPTSEWSTDRLRDEYLKQKHTAEGVNVVNEITVSNTGLSTDRTPNLIAFEINSIKEQTRKLVLYNSIEIGRRLVEVKDMLEHGEWGNWLDKSVDYSQRTANNLMKIFDEFGADQIALFGDNANSQTFANLSYSQAIALLGVPKEEREEFVKENDVENMSTRDLQQAIKEKLELEKKLNNAKDTAKQLAD
ncbi:MAG: DUF3102 domain-containing protein, partial [Carboxydocellales bacterium]